MHALAAESIGEGEEDVSSYLMFFALAVTRRLYADYRARAEGEGNYSDLNNLS